MALALARLFDGERQYTQLLRQLSRDPGTALALRLVTLRKRLDRLNEKGAVDLELLVLAADTLAREQLDEGVRLLAAFIISRP